VMDLRRRASYAAFTVKAHAANVAATFDFRMPQPFIGRARTAGLSSLVLARTSRAATDVSWEVGRERGRGTATARALTAGGSLRVYTQRNRG